MHAIECISFTSTSSNVDNEMVSFSELLMESLLDALHKAMVELVKFEEYKAELDKSLQEQQEMASARQAYGNNFGAGLSKNKMIRILQERNIVLQAIEKLEHDVVEIECQLETARNETSASMPWSDEAAALPLQTSSSSATAAVEFGHSRIIQQPPSAIIIMPTSFGGNAIAAWMMTITSILPRQTTWRKYVP